MNQERLERLAAAIADSECDAVAFNAGPSFSYFSGLDFHLMERPVVMVYVPGQLPVLILPRLEAAKLKNVSGVFCYYYDENPREWGSVFRKALQKSGSNLSLGVEPHRFRFLEYSLLSEAAERYTFTSCSEIIGSLRGRKDEGEISRMQKAVDIAENALRSTLPVIRPGLEEKEIAAELLLQLFRHGSESTLPFAPIVSSGPNGANPHAKPSKRKICSGDLLVVDWGASYEGYVSDITRTFAVGNIDDEAIRIHEIVQQANAAGRKAGRVGKECREVDNATRKIIEDEGYGEFFTHRTGHGIGMECHEEPYIHKDNLNLLQPGMTFTVEPGIYLPGKYGVRIEDDVVVTEEGVQTLSTLPRRIVQVG